MAGRLLFLLVLTPLFDVIAIYRVLGFVDPTAKLFAKAHLSSEPLRFDRHTLPINLYKTLFVLSLRKSIEGYLR